MLREMHNAVARHASRISHQSRQLEIASVVLAATTTGALWGLVTKAFGSVAQWVGAILATGLTVITAYQNVAKLEKRHRESVLLYRDIGREMARLRASKAFTPERFWTPYKRFESRCLALNIQLPDSRASLSRSWGDGGPMIRESVNSLSVAGRDGSLAGGGRRESNAASETMEG
jgi:hypothetical protein